MPYTTATPRGLTDAHQIVADPARFADRPSLVQLARYVAASALGYTITQRRLASPTPRQPRLRVIRGGREADHTGPEAA